MTPLNKLGFYIGRFTPFPLWRLLVWYFYHKGQEDPAVLFDRDKDRRPAADDLILSDPEFLERCMKSSAEGLRQGTLGFAWEARLITRDWGFPLGGIRVPVHVWHGTADIDTPVAMGKEVAARIPGSRLTICPDEAHNLLVPHWKEILTDLLKN